MNKCSNSTWQQIIYLIFIFLFIIGLVNLLSGCIATPALANASIDLGSMDTKPQNEEIDAQNAQHQLKGEMAPQIKPRPSRAPLLIDHKPKNTISRYNGSNRRPCENSGACLDFVIQGGISDEAHDSLIKEIRHEALNEYLVELGADAVLEIPGVPGELRVWIGFSSQFKGFPKDMQEDSTMIPAIGKTAKIEPFAPGFDMEPKESQCIKIHPTGSEVRFKLFPKKEGEYEVGANVNLFESLDCSGIPVPKTTATLTVEVTVNDEEINQERFDAASNIFWVKVLEFWEALLGLAIALFLFLIRKNLKRIFGYDKD